MSEFWNTLEDDKALSNAAALAKEYKDITDTKAALDVREKELKNSLLGLFDQEFGEQIKTFDGYQVTVDVGERWDWDSEMLAQIFETSETLPHHIVKKLTVHRRTFEKLNDSQKAEVIPALTRNFGTVKIKVEKNA
jgi:hypothetical protein